MVGGYRGRQQRAARRQFIAGHRFKPPRQALVDSVLKVMIGLRPMSQPTPLKGILGLDAIWERSAGELEKVRPLQMAAQTPLNLPISCPQWTAQSRHGWTWERALQHAGSADQVNRDDRGF